MGTYAGWIVAGALLVLLALRSMQLAEAESEISRLRDQLMRAQGQDGLVGPGAKAGAQAGGDSGAGSWESAVRSLIQQNQKIQAIKLYREKTGLGLKEAKDAVEAMER